jgi:protein involved in polysaccharide export with SLBB domain
LKCDGGVTPEKKRTVGIVAILRIAAFLALPSLGAEAQSVPPGSLQDLVPEQAQQYLGMQGRAITPGQTPTVQPELTILQPTAPATLPSKPSRLEQIMSVRAGVVLSLFGYDELGVGRPVALPQIGGLQDGYVLGPGDEIVVTLRGQENAEYRVLVDRDGRVVLPRLNPVSAGGRSLQEFRQDVSDAIHRAYPSSEAYVAVGRLRQISVVVAGEVGTPGIRTLTGLSTPLDAILVSGGIKKTGTLRAVRLTRGPRTVTIDFYSFLATGSLSNSIVLADGDRIFVPPITKVVAAAGWFRRPGIYELPPGKSAVSVGALENLAGGLEVRGQYRLAVSQIEISGQTRLQTVAGRSGVVRDGEVLLALPGAEQTVGRAVLSGGTALAGSYAIKNGMRLSDLLKAPGALGPSPYTIFGIVARRDPRTYLRSLIAFSPITTLEGDEDVALLDDDIVRVFSMSEAKLLSRAITQYEKRKQRNEEIVRNPYLAATEQERTSEGGAAGSTAYGLTAATGAVLQARENAAQGSGMQSTLQNNQALENDQTTQNYQVTPPTSQNEVSSGITGETAPPSNSPMSTAQDEGAAPTATVAGTQTEAGQIATGLGRQPEGIQGSLGATMGKVTLEVPPPNFEEEVPSKGMAPQNIEATTLEDIASQLRIDRAVLISFLEDHEVTLNGAVRAPGTYVVGPGVNLHDLVTVAGGTARWADESGVELITTDVNQRTGSAVTVRKVLSLNESNLANYDIKAHDEFRFREVFNDIGLGSVTLEGEVRFPGEYRIVRGERLTDLLKRAGGLTEVAYPFGTVYLRRSAAAVEEESFRRTADQIENQLLLAMSRNTVNPKLDPSAFKATEGFLTRLRTQKGLGRVSIVADPAVLADQPEQDTLLEGGDVIYVPQRPSTISVMGEVLEPGSFVYHPNFSAEDYLSKAGGSTAFADESLTFIVLPDGSAVKLEQAWLPFDSQRVPPGSTIVVPRDIAPLQWSDILTNASQIFSQLAVAGASLAVISTNLK